MILQSLVEYYEALEKKGEITRPGWCKAKISFALDISETGVLLRVLPLKIEKQRGKKTSDGNSADGSSGNGNPLFRCIGKFFM